MAQFEYEFSTQDRELILTQDSNHIFSGTDYIRLTIYPTEAIDNIVTLDDGDGNIRKGVFYASLYDETAGGFDINVSPFENNLQITPKTIGIYGGRDYNDFKIYKNQTTDDIYIKPNEILNDFGLPQGDYKIQIDFLNQLKPPFNDTIAGEHFQFLIKEISTSRKEVRLKLLNTNIINNSPIIDRITTLFNQNNNNVTTEEYQFKHILNVGTGDHIPIMNYEFDKITDGKDNQSLILKLYNALPTSISNLKLVTIEKEVITTQVQNTFYFSEVPDVFFGDGLQTDYTFNDTNLDNNDIGFQSLDELALSSSLGLTEVDSLLSQSEYGYPNLNTDFNEFANHTFFGSAKKKLENFKNKVKTIQNNYSIISSSLVVSCSLEGDSNFTVQKRENAFNKVREEIKNFSPYERFLYFDGQTESTASAPSLGKNYAHSVALREASSIVPFDGFETVYKFEQSNTLPVAGEKDFSQFVYKVHEKPFFNHSGSFYLSFLAKSTDDLPFNRTIENHEVLGIQQFGFPVPYDTSYTASILTPINTGSEYRRFIYEASQSFYIPKSDNNDMADLNNIVNDFGPESTKVTILSGSIKTGSYRMRDSVGKFPTTVTSMSIDGTVIPGAPFFGSVMPAGDLFSITIPPATDSSHITKSFVTDVKVTTTNPTNVLPFDNVFHTSSTEWNNWYNDMLTKAETFDTNNIHSFENNLPLYIQESSEYNEMKDFLNLQGEQYDLIRNHVDSMGTLHKRGYKKTNSPPEETLPMLLSNMGWQAINPFSGSLSQTLGGYLSGVTSIDDIKNNTWRKTLNNLIYIYKSKGTKNSVRALLNTYGYPPDVLEFQEFGGSTQNTVSTENTVANSIIINNKPPSGTGNIDLQTKTGSFGITNKKRKLYRYIVNSEKNRILNFDWWMDGANINSFQFIYKHTKTTNTQKLLNLSGSNTQSMWDLRLIPSSDGASSSLEFRLNNSLTGSLPIASNAVSMSTPYVNLTNGQLWNVMLQRMTGSTSTNIVNEYRLHLSHQEGKKITNYNLVSMSISGAGSTDSQNIANQNWMSSGSRHALSSSNLFVGETLSGSLAEVRAWSSALSISRFRQHTLNKFSTVGNTIDSHRKELYYHFKLNENYSSSSLSSSVQNLNIIDSAPKTTLTTNYSFEKNRNAFTGSSTYGFDINNVVTFTLQDNNSFKANDNNILISPKRNVIGNLSPIQAAVKSLTIENSKPLIVTSRRLELYRSPQTFVDDFILDTITGFNLETLYGNPFNYYSQSYDEFDTFRENFFDAHPIEVDVNDFIRAHENMFNQSIVEGMQSLVPASSTFSDRNSNFGVEIKPTILEKQKYENEKHSVEVNPNLRTGSIVFTENTEYKQSSLVSTFEQPHTGSIVFNLNESGSIELPHTDTISLGNAYVTSSGYLKNAPAKNHFQIPFLQPDGYVTTIENPRSASLSPLPTYDGSTVVLTKDGTIDYASHANKSYVDIHKNWGTSSNDTFFINYFGGIDNDSGSDGNYNTYHIDTRVVFRSIGDHEYYSGSRDFTTPDIEGNLSGSGNMSSDFMNPNRFYNRLILSDTIHKNVRYDSKNFFPGTGIVTGRMMGKTRYFTTSSDGNIVLPNNHVSRYPDHYLSNLRGGTQNINPGFLNVQHEDYASSSFYRVNVTPGENQIYVKGTSSPTRGKDDKIIY